MVPDKKRKIFENRGNLSRCAGLLACLAACLSVPSAAQQASEVDLALVLAVDCSHSVNASEFDLQMQGLAQAFRSADVIAAIGSAKIAVTVIEWSGRSDQKIAVPWIIVSNPASAHVAAGAIAAAPRLSVGKTSISAAIDFSIGELERAPFSARRQVIDISADGINNDGGLTKTARDRALQSEITINGLTILNDVGNLDSYFRDFIIGGPGSFVVEANDYADYGDAIKRKLLREINSLRMA